MKSYSQWFVNEMGRLADETVTKSREIPFGNFYLYFKPLGLAFAIVHEDDKASDGFELVTGEKIPTHRSREGLTAWFASMTARIPVLPVD